MIISQLKSQLQTLLEMLDKINNNIYTTPVVHLNNSSIGNHTRHIIELLQCLVNGYNNAEVDYVNRKRNLLLEQEIYVAKNIISELLDNVNLPNKPLKMAVDSNGNYIYSNSDREIVYNTEHIIHHLALIKVALIEMGLSEITNEEFGMAYATIRYRNSLTVNQ